MKKLLIYCIIFVCFSFCSDDKDTVANTPIDDEIATDDDTLTETSLFSVVNTKIIDPDGDSVNLQGMSFNNYIWEDGPLHNPDHHSEIDYQRVRDMGMNVVRFYMNYEYLEDDTNPYTYLDSGWKWLDDNIEWAKNNNIYLILNMHAPQGGYQSQGAGDALWEVQENQNRLSALWKEIALRYKDEAQIIGYGLVNEPIPTSSLSIWSALAQRLINDIRGLEDEHIIFVEQAIRVKSGINDPENFDFPSVVGSNLVYEFHDYNPYFYTHQLLEFAQLGDGGKYPDETVFETGNSQWYTGIFNNPKITQGDTAWSFFEGINYTVDDPEIAFAVPVLYGSRVEGKIWFDTYNITEYDENGNLVGTVFEENLNTQGSWTFWSQDGLGDFGVSTTDGNGDSGSIYIENTLDLANLSNNSQRFIPVAGHSYKVSAWLKGENIASNADAGVGLDFYTIDGDFVFRNKAFLRQNIKEISDWGIANNVPVYLGEFGTGTPTFENGKGGLIYMEDMLAIIEEFNIPFTYHAYHEDAFGLYQGYGPPNTANSNQELIAFFTSRLAQ